MMMKARENAPAAVLEGSGEFVLGTPSPRAVRWAQALVLVALYSIPALVYLRTASASDPDVWWHLRSAEWIVQHHAAPWTDPFSSAGAGKFWAAYSWLFELLIFKLFQWLGLAGIVVYTAGMVAAIAMALHHLIRRLQADFTFGVLLTFAASYSMVRLYTPRPWLFTILFFTLELDILMQARRTGKTRELLRLPVIFALWANVHIQFIDGLVVLAIALAEAVLARRWTSLQTRLRAGWLGGICLACVLATLVNPYGWRIYRVAYDLAAQPGVMSKVAELSALPFRHIDDWLVLLLALAAVAVLARASGVKAQVDSDGVMRGLNPPSPSETSFSAADRTRRGLFFEGALLAFAIYVSFRTQRDLWVVVIAASAILASRITGDEKNRFQLTTYFAPLVVAATGLAVALGFCALRVDNASLCAKLVEELPVRAVEVVQEKGWSGPLYNDYGWGGYLIWALRMPVSIDGRAAMHGDAALDRSEAVWNGQPEWASDPDLRRAGLVIGPVRAPLTQLLRTDPRFELGYEDQLAVVFVARPAPPSVTAKTGGTATRSGQ
jgi:hypothetical protein